MTAFRDAINAAYDEWCDIGADPIGMTLSGSLIYDTTSVGVSILDMPEMQAIRKALGAAVEHATDPDIWARCHGITDAVMDWIEEP